MIALACPHGDLRDCHACLSLAHEWQTNAAIAMLRRRPRWDEEGTLADTIFARNGFNLLSKIGIAPPVMVWPYLCPTCHIRTDADDSPARPCVNRACPGRRVRFQPPEVR